MFVSQSYGGGGTLEGPSYCSSHADGQRSCCRQLLVAVLAPFDKAPGDLCDKYVTASIVSTCMGELFLGLLWPRDPPSVMADVGPSLTSVPSCCKRLTNGSSYGENNSLLAQRQCLDPRFQVAAIFSKV
ncbi:hypothetical protein GWK47_002568 [Chionoecetes opilio]|uniref:Uncharacterized protein n=1 Tax=Chionoecetes opilio TaxID=41210 RepID=A0A8J5CJU1_CHIOP|nr:hypothetical protein GWK47_002568 [Chionoecetes opilio]